MAPKKKVATGKAKEEPDKEAEDTKKRKADDKAEDAPKKEAKKETPAKEAKKEKEVDEIEGTEKEKDAPADKRPAFKEAISFRPADCTLNVLPTYEGKVLMALSEGGMQYLIAGARAN